MNNLKILLIVLLLSTGLTTLAQSNIDSLIDKINPDKWAASIERKAEKLQERIITKSQKALSRLQKQEEKIYDKMLKGKDSVQAKASLEEIRVKYNSLQQQISGSSLSSGNNHYYPQLDTIINALKFLNQGKPSGKMNDALTTALSLQDKFQQAEEIKAFIKERKKYLGKQMEALGLSRQIRRLNKETYYYSVQIVEFRELIRSPKKLERRAVEILRNTKLFKNFMRQNSQLAALFRLPGDPSDSPSPINLAGLQTRVLVNNRIQQQIGPNPVARQRLSNNLQDAQDQLNSLKDKLQLSGGNSDADIPEGFKPNTAKTKTFLQRLSLITDFQTAKHNNFFPVSSDIGLGVSYMMNSNSHIMIGSSFKIGWGTGIDHISITSQGIGFRAGLNYRLKGNFFMVGNYEQNYFSQIDNTEQLSGLKDWKQSAMLGLSKKYRFGKKKTGEIKLLYDFLHNGPPVKTQPITIRFGFYLK